MAPFRPGPPGDDPKVRHKAMQKPSWAGTERTASQHRENTTAGAQPQAWTSGHVQRTQPRGTAASRGIPSACRPRGRRAGSRWAVSELGPPGAGAAPGSRGKPSEGSERCPLSPAWRSWGHSNHRKSCRSRRRHLHLTPKNHCSIGQKQQEKRKISHIDPTSHRQREPR